MLIERSVETNVSMYVMPIVAQLWSGFTLGCRRLVPAYLAIWAHVGSPSFLLAGFKARLLA